MNYELLDGSLQPCGSASLAQILAMRSERERLEERWSLDDELSPGPSFYCVGSLKLEVSAAVPAAVTIAQIAASAKRVYERMASEIEYMPEPVSANQAWGVVISQAHELLVVSMQAARAAGHVGFKFERVSFPDRRALEETLERLAIEFSDGDPIRIAVDRFIAMLRRPVGLWTKDESFAAKKPRRQDSSLEAILAMRPPKE